MNCDDTGFLASELEFNIQFYEGGISRVLIGEKNNERFRISQEELPVEWSQLKPALSSNLTISELSVLKEDDTLEVFMPALNEGDEDYSWLITFDPLRIDQYVNDEGVQVINPTPSLYVEDTTSADSNGEGSTCFAGLRERVQKSTGKDLFGPQDKKT